MSIDIPAEQSTGSSSEKPLLPTQKEPKNLQEQKHAALKKLDPMVALRVLAGRKEEVQSLSRIQEDIKPKTHDETLMAVHMADLEKDMGKNPTVNSDGDKVLQISTDTIYEVADSLDQTVSQDPSNITQLVLNALGSSAVGVFKDNSAVQRVVLDASLARQAQAKDVYPARRRVITEAREFLHQPDLPCFSKYYIGTSSAILPGIEQANGRLLSIAKLREEGVPQFTGEGTRVGAMSRIEDKQISASTLW